MTNKELYDAAVKNGLAFRYFKGEEECPEYFEDTIQEQFWRVEAYCADRNYNQFDLPKKLYAEDIEYDKYASDENEKRVPEFITSSSAPDAEKIVAYDCYASLRYDSNGFGYLRDSISPEPDADELSEKPYNWNRGFDKYFD